ncbi:glycosyltransferase family protein [Ferruginibacter albus]|uniref:hypothetical protein n=1 Tax=Ferruginibacter albus TaxID=2875540 RepID=UPI001CC55ABF|nr:hypothetical protein [Ferruginibacter albus]UAY50682.1 hypothetical protein K9M53_08750 [Ferruginibacter albus]
MSQNDFSFINKKIFLLSPERWSNMRRSKHNYAIELAKMGNKVFFLEPANVKTKEISVHEIIKDALWVVNYPLIARGKNILPAFFYNQIVKYEVKKITQHLNAVPDVVWSFDPVRIDRIAFFKKAIKIFHPVDFWNEKQFPSKKAFDIAFSPMQKQVDIFNENGYKTFFINHGLSEQFVKYSLEKLKDIHHDLPAHSDRKINVGYVGSLISEPPDRDVMKMVIEDNPDLTFHFWGEYEKDIVKAAYFHPEFISYLQAKENVKLYGSADTETIARSIAPMDIFWMCWKTNENSMWNSDTNPHKIIEYLSTGKPVVTHFMKKYLNTNLLYMCAEENNKNLYLELFNSAIFNITKGENIDKIKERIQYALDNTYQKQIQRISFYINQHLN